MNEHVLVSYVARKLILYPLPSDIIPVVALYNSIESLRLHVDLACKTDFFQSPKTDLEGIQQQDILVLMVILALFISFQSILDAVPTNPHPEEVTYFLVQELNQLKLSQSVQILMHPNLLFLLNYTVFGVSDHVAKFIKNEMFDFLVRYYYTLCHVISSVDLYDEIEHFCWV